VAKETGLTKKILKALSKPFPEDAIGWKAQALNKDKTMALAVPHITARHVMNRLDEIVGSPNWTTNFEFVPGIKAAKVMLTIFGITKSDIGFVAGDDDAAIKGSVSDGLKRAAVLFGIGRYLYEVERQWVGWDNQGRRFTEQPQLVLKNNAKPAEAKPNKAAEAEPGETKHWIEYGPARKKFWAFAHNTLGLSDKDVYEALGVERVHDFEGTMKEAKALLEDYIEEHLA